MLFKRVRCLLLVLICMVAVFALTMPVSAYETTKTSTDYYICPFHSLLGWDSCVHITFYSHGETASGTVYDKYFSDSYAHWPNGFTYGNVWSYTVGTTGYAKGTYTSYSSLITEWVSLAWDSITKTMVHTY